MEVVRYWNVFHRLAFLLFIAYKLTASQCFVFNLTDGRDKDLHQK